MYDPNVVKPQAYIQSMSSMPVPLHSVIQDYYNASIHNSLEDLVRSMLYKRTMIPCVDKKFSKNYSFIPGCTFEGVVGPAAEHDVMVIGRIPPSASFMFSLGDAASPIRELFGESVSVLSAAFESVGINRDTYKDFYATNIIRFHSLKTKGQSLVPSWAKVGMHLLHQEIALCRPKLILCLGSEACKAVINRTLKKSIGMIHEHRLEFTPYHDFDNPDKLITPDAIVSKVICVPSPHLVAKDFESHPAFVSAIQFFSDTLLEREREVIPCNFDCIEYAYAADAGEGVLSLEDKINELIREGKTKFSVDCEWAGDHYYDGTLRTIQVAWSLTEAFIVVLAKTGTHHEGGKPKFMRETFSPNRAAAAAELCRLFHRKGVEISGHNLVEDAIWLKDFGVDITDQFSFDTMLACHLKEPTGDHTLKSVAVACIPGWQRHDAELVDWLTEHPIKPGDGFGYVPDAILHPYAARDACSTFELTKYFKAWLDEPGNEGLRQLSRMEVRALEPLQEIQMTGMLMDRERLIETRESYKSLYDKRLFELRRLIGDPQFKPSSTDHKVDLLFSKLELTPIKTTGDYSKMWEDVVSKGTSHLYSPAVDSETLSILSHKNPIVQVLDEVCSLKPIITNFLQEEVLNPKTGNYEIKGGLLGFMKGDNRLYTSISQMIKTGRLSTKDPNLSNMPGKREKAIQDIFNRDESFKGRVPSLRSAFIAPPGHVIIASDYKQAELAALAYLSGDPKLIEAVEQGKDMHGVVCKQMFKLDCEDHEVKKLHYRLRVAAKAIVFGLLYGRGAPAIAREVQKEGIECTVSDAQDFMDAFMRQFPRVEDLINEVHRMVVSKGYVETLWGRREYFPKPAFKSESVEKRQKRMAFNFIIQGYVGDLLRKSLINFSDIKKVDPEAVFKIGMTVYDSTALIVPLEFAEHVADVIVPDCMVARAKNPKIDFSIGVDTEVFLRWEVAPTVEELKELRCPDTGTSLPESFCIKYGKAS